MFKFIITISTVILIDQFSKQCVIEYFYKSGELKSKTHENNHIVIMYEPIIITSFFNLSYVWNRGIIFGIFSANSSQLFIVFISIFVIVLYFLCLAKYLVFKNIDITWCGAIMGGAVANVIDRIKFGAVFDFLDFHVLDYHYPSFNIADVAIVIGIILTYFILYKERK